METNNSNHSSTTMNAVNAATEQTASPAPEDVVAQIQAIRKSLPEVAPLTTEQRRAVRSQIGRMSNEVLQAQINVMTVSDAVVQVVGQPSAGIRQLVDDSNRWTAVEDALKTLLASVQGGNLIRRQKLALVARFAYKVGASLATVPEHAELVPQVAEVRRLTRISRRRKAPSSSDTPAPQHQPAPTEPHAGGM